MGDVVQFPKSAQIRPITGNDARESLDAVRTYQTDELADILMEEFFLTCATAGFDFSEDSLYMKDLTMVLQSFRSILRKHHGLGHPLQLMTQAAFEEDADGSVNFREVLTNLPVADEV